MSQSFVLDTLAVRKEASLVLERGGWKSMTLFREIKTDDPEVLVRVKVIGGSFPWASWVRFFSFFRVEVEANNESGKETGAGF